MCDEAERSEVEPLMGAEVCHAAAVPSWECQSDVGQRRQGMAQICSLCTYYHTVASDQFLLTMSMRLLHPAGHLASQQEHEEVGIGSS